MRDALIAIAIYSVSSVYLIIKNQTFPIGWDRMGEYRYFEALLAGQSREPGNLRSCFTVYWLPYLARRLTSIDATMLFRMIPPFFYALLPVFVYLSARMFAPVEYALLAVGLVVSGFEFAYYTDTGRVGMALSLMALLYWGVLAGNYWVVAAGASLLVMTHYGTAHYLLFVLGGAWLFALITGDSSIFPLSFALNFLFAGIWIWYSILQKQVGIVCGAFIKSAFEVEKQIVFKVQETSGARYQLDVDNYRKVVAQGRQFSMVKKSGFWDIDNRDSILKTVLGRNWRDMSLPRKAEWFTSWALLIFMVVSTAAGIPGAPGIVVMLAVMSLLATFLAVIIPRISTGYGLERTWFSGLVFILPLAVRGMHVTGIPVILIFPFLLIHFLLVSGVVHRLAGINKYAGLREYRGNR